MKEERHPNIEQIIWVLKHLNSIWKKDATIGYVLKMYTKSKEEQEKECRH